MNDDSGFGGGLGGQVDFGAGQTSAFGPGPGASRGNTATAPVEDHSFKPKFERAFSEILREISWIEQESAFLTGYMYPCNGRYCLKLRL